MSRLQEALEALKGTPWECLSVPFATAEDKYAAAADLVGWALAIEKAAAQDVLVIDPTHKCGGL